MAYNRRQSPRHLTYLSDILNTNNEQAHMIDVWISRSFIFLTVVSQSSISIGLSPSVKMTILRVQVGFFARYLACVSMPTITESIADGKSNERKGQLDKQSLELTVSNSSRRLNGLDLRHRVCIWLNNGDELGDMLVSAVGFVDDISCV